MENLIMILSALPFLAALLTWLITIGLAMQICEEKGRSQGAGTVAAIVFGPLALLYYLLAPSRKPLAVYLIERPEAAKEQPAQAVSGSPPPEPPPVIPEAQPIMIAVQCRCGATFRIAERMYKRAKCPKCGERLTNSAASVLR